MSTPPNRAADASGTGPAAAIARHGSVAASLRADARWRAWEAAVFAAFALSWWLLPAQALLLKEVAVVALFAVSLDLILGYAGIVSLGHAAFFGFGAYGAALFAKHVMPDPLVGLAVATALAAALGLATSVLILRGSDLTRLMVTLGVASILYELANRLDGVTGGADGLQGVVMGPLLGRFEFDLAGRVAYAYVLVVLALCLLGARRLVHSPFGISLQALRDNRLRATAIGLSVNARLVAVYTIAAAMAGAAGALLAQTTGFASLDVFDFHRSAEVLLMLVIGGTGYLYGGLFGALAFKLLHDLVSAWTPQYWTFWLGLFLVVLVLVGRDRLLRPGRWVRSAKVLE
jgi:branched-chain amino acid transport system permease protein